MEINYLLQIENIATLCCYNLNVKMKYVCIKILWLIGLIFELRIGLVFQ